VGARWERPHGLGYGTPGPAESQLGGDGYRTMPSPRLVSSMAEQWFHTPQAAGSVPAPATEGELDGIQRPGRGPGKAGSTPVTLPARMTREAWERSVKPWLRHGWFDSSAWHHVPGSGSAAEVPNLHQAPVVQWIGHRPPEPATRVRVLPGALCRYRLVSFYLCGTVRFVTQISLKTNSIGRTGRRGSGIVTVNRASVGTA
jgi:hypothetical protein